MAPCALQQVQRRGLGVAGSLDHGFVFGRVFVRFEQNFVQLLTHRLRALATGQFFGPGGDLQRHGFFLLDGVQRQLKNVGRGLLEAALARAAKVVR